VLDLESLCVAIARMGRPELDPGEVGGTLDSMAARVGDHLAVDAPPDRLAMRLAGLVGGELDFHGDPEAPVGPADSYIDQVLVRRRGLPILLSVVWILLGRRLGLPIAGVNYPGHFLVCLDAPGARIYLDPYSGGRARDAAQLMGRLGPEARERGLLEPCGVRPIVTRILVNLKNQWLDAGAYAEALGAVDRILLIGGEVPGELRDRGLVCLHLNRPGDAARDFRRYLTLRPEAEDRSVIEALLGRIEGAT